MRLTHVDLFSGIGGFALAAQHAGFETVLFCEINEFCQQVLRKHWPNVPIVDDITKLKGDDFANPTVITGGFPCQPFSCTGRRKGTNDPRALWPEMRRIISEAHPSWVLGENVVGFQSLGLDNAVADLENLGYETVVFSIPACSIDAHHERKRIWIVANALRRETVRPELHDACIKHSSKPIQDKKRILRLFDNSKTATPQKKITQKNTIRRQNSVVEGYWSRCIEDTFEPWPSEPKLGRMVNGVSHWVDRCRSLGNAIVPQIAQIILSAIAIIELNCSTPMNEQQCIG